MLSRYLSTILFVSLLAFSAASYAQATAAQPSTPKQEAPLSNKDVVKLAKLGLGDEVVIAKIKQATTVDFDVTTDGLVQLKQSAVSGPIIAAMLDRATAKTSSNAAAPSTNGTADIAGQDVRILIGQEEVPLPSSRGDFSTTGFWPVFMTYLDYPGLHARVRTTETRPALVVRSQHNPTSYYYIGKLDVNDEEENNRSLKIEQKSGAFTATSRVIPSGRWHVEYDASETSPGIWRLVPRRDLVPGEYGMVVPGGVLYEFGVD